MKSVARYYTPWSIPRMDFTPLAFVLLLPLVNWDPCLIKIVVSLSLSEKTYFEPYFFRTNGPFL